MDVKAFKLTNGDEIIAEITDTKFAHAVPSVFTIKRPLQLRAQMTPEGPQLGFFPWAMMLPEGETCELTNRSFFICYDPVEDVKNDYIRNVTGIDIVTRPTQILHS